MYNMNRNGPYALNEVPEIGNLKELILYCASEYNDKTVFRYEKDNKEINITFLQLLDDVNALGTALLFRNLNKKKIALIGENSYYWILAYFAVVNGGNIIVPLEHDMPEETLNVILRETDISCIICSRKYVEKINKEIIKNYVQNLFLIDDDIDKLIKDGKELINKNYRSFIDLVIYDDECSTIAYTSGTTSQSKGVMLSHKNIVADAIAAIKNVYFAGTSILVLPLHHTFSFTASVLCLMLSGRTIAINSNIKDLKKDFVKYQPQNIILVPMIIESIYKQIWIQAKKSKKDYFLNRLIRISNFLLKRKIDLRRNFFSSIHNSLGGKLEFIISGGAPLHDKYVKGFREIGVQILNGYGITECSPVLAVNRNNYFKDHSVGQVLDGVEIKIVNDEILVRGDVVTKGYYNNNKLTREAFDSGWFKTGDLGYIDNEGFLYITGRKKNLLVLSNGKKICPEELEEYLYSLNYVKEAIVFQNGDRIEAEVYLGNDNIEILKKNIQKDIEIMNRMYPGYRRISNIIIRKSQFPKTSTNKIRRNV